MPSASPPRPSPGSHSAVAVAHRQQRIAQQLEANPPPVEEEIVPTVGAGKTLSMAKLAELSKPRKNQIEEPETVPYKSPPKKPSKLSPSQSRLQSQQSQQSQSKLQQTQSKQAQPPSKLQKSPSKIGQPQSKLTQPQSKRVQPHSKLAQPQSKLAQPQSKLAQPQSKLSQLRKPVMPQPTTKGQPVASPELQYLLAQAKEAQEHLERIAQVKDVTNGRATGDSQAEDAQHSDEASSSAPAAPSLPEESAEMQKTADAQKPSGFFGAFSALWRKNPADPTSAQNEAATQASEQHQGQQAQPVADVPAGADISTDLLDFVESRQGAEQVSQMQHAPEPAVHAAAEAAVMQQFVPAEAGSIQRTTPQPILPPSATAPFATDDTPSHTITSITRPSQNAVLPQQAFIQNSSYTAAQQQLFSLPIPQSELPERSIRTLNSARRPHPMEAISFLQRPQPSALVATSHAATAISHPVVAFQPPEQGTVSCILFRDNPRRCDTWFNIIHGVAGMHVLIKKACGVAVGKYTVLMYLTNG